MTGLSTATMLLMLSPMAHAFLRPIGPVAVSRARWSKVNSASQVCRGLLVGTPHQQAMLHWL